MKFMTIAWVAVAAVVVGQGRARATPFDASRVPVSAEGVGHVDVDALRKTTIYSLAKSKLEASGKMDMDPKVRIVAEAVMKNAQGVTFWMGQDRGAAVVKLSSTVILAPLLREAQKKVLTINGRKVERYSQKGEDTAIAIVGDQVVLSSDEVSLMTTVNVLVGKGKSIPRGRVPVPTANGVFFFASLGDKLLDKVRKAAESQTLKVDMTALTIDVAEVNAELRGRLRAVMASAENAAKVKSVVDGLLALASLAEEAKQFEAFLERVSVTATGKNLEIAVSIPSAELVKMAESMK